MTTTHHIQVAAGGSRGLRRLARLAEPALGMLVFTLVTGAWLTLFMLLTFGYTLPRPG